MTNILIERSSKKDNAKFNIYMHYGGHLEEHPKLVYTSDKVIVFKGWDANSISRSGLLDIYHTVDDATNVKFFYQVPCCPLEIGVVPIQLDEDIDELVYYYRDIEEMHIYAENYVQWVTNNNLEKSACEGIGGSAPDLEDHLTDREQNSEKQEGDICVDDVRLTDIDNELLSDDDDTFEKAEIEELDKTISGSCLLAKYTVPDPDIHGSTSSLLVGELQDSDWNEAIDEDAYMLDAVWCDEEDQRVEHQDFNTSVEFAKSTFELKVSQRFTNVKTFREALVEWHVREGYEFKYIKNESTRVTVVCKRRIKKDEKGNDVVVCHWRLHASPIQDTTTFQIKSIKNTHECGREYTNVHATARYLSQKMQHSFMDDPNMSVPSIVNSVRRVCMIDISSKKAYRTKCKARATLQGIDMEQYHRVRDYAQVLLNHNPGSRVTLRIDRYTENEVGTFQRMYFSLRAMAEGFVAGCRPIIGLDGCFLKSSFGGQLLTAMGRDGNDNMFPIAMAVVEAEIFDSWAWFLDELKQQIGEGTYMPWTFISDRQKGLVHAVNHVFPQSNQRFCLRHMYQNFKNTFKGQEFKDMFWAAASAGNKHDFQRAIARLESVDPKISNRVTASEWLMRIPTELWSRAHFSHGCKSDILVNNLNESFNAYVLQARDKPIISMFEWIRRKLMQRMNTKRLGMQQYVGNICPNIQKRIESNKRLSRHCTAVYSSQGEYEVDCASITHLVNLSNRTCTCGLFQLTGIPCIHAVAAIQKDKRPVEDYVDKCYWKETYLKAYSDTIKGIPSMDYWDTIELDPINPPRVKKQPGRPKKLRKRKSDEPRPGSTRRGLTIHCKRCFKAGHNSRTCKYPVHPKSRFYKAPQTDSSSLSTDPVNAHTSMGSQGH